MESFNTSNIIETKKKEEEEMENKAK